MAFEETTNMDFNADFFALFGQVPAYRIDAGRLDQRYREIQALVHPDRFASSGDSERRLSLQWATRVNEAYSTLRAPLRRAKYLLNLVGHDVEVEKNTSMPPEFLIEQMEWRESVEEARRARQHDELEQLFFRVKQVVKRGYDELAELLDDQHDYVQAADRVRRLMFLEKLLVEIDDAMAAVEI